MAMPRCLVEHRVPAAFLFVVSLPALAIALSGAISPYWYVFFVTAVFVLVVTTVLTLPVFLLMRSRGWLRWSHMLAAGALCGELGAMLFLGNHHSALGAVTVFAAAGGAMGLLFWWLAICRNPAYSVASRWPSSVALVVPLLVPHLATQRHAARKAVPAARPSRRQPLPALELVRRRRATRKS